MTEKQITEKALEPEMIEVHTSLYKPFYDFLKEYLAFFGSKQTVEDACRKMIYWHVELLHQELEDFVSESPRFIEKGAFFDKWPHISIVATPDENGDKP